MPKNFPREFHHKAPADPRRRLIGAIGFTIAFGIAYFFAARLSLAVLAKSDGFALFWLAGGVASGVLIAVGRDARVPIASGTVVASIIAHLMGGRNIWVSTSYAVCNAGEALFTAWLIERYFGLGFGLDRLRSVVGLVTAAVVSNAASAVCGTVAYELLQSPTAPFWVIWQRWFASGAIGTITVAPLVIGLAAALRIPPRRDEIIEGGAALVALAAVMTFIIVSLPQKPWEMVAPVALLFPILWPAARCQPVFAAGAAFIASLAIVWTVTSGIGHFGDQAHPISAQAAILVVALCA